MEWRSYLERNGAEGPGQTSVRSSSGELPLARVVRATLRIPADISLSLDSPLPLPLPLPLPNPSPSGYLCSEERNGTERLVVVPLRISRARDHISRANVFSSNAHTQRDA